MLLVLGFIFISGCGQRAESCFGYSQQNRPKDFTLLYTLPVKFSNCSTEAESFYWDFGDGNSSTEKNPEHKYSNQGIFTVTLTSRFKNKEQKSSKTITLAEPSQSDSLLHTWLLTQVQEYLLNNNYPVDSSEINFSKTLWIFEIDGSLRISGFPQSANENWTLVNHQLITSHKTYSIVELKPKQLILSSADTLNPGHQGIKAVVQRKLTFQSMNETP